MELDSGNADSARPFYVASLLVEPCCGKSCIKNVEVIYIIYCTKYIHIDNKDPEGAVYSRQGNTDGFFIFQPRRS